MVAGAKKRSGEKASLNDLVWNLRVFNEVLTGIRSEYMRSRMDPKNRDIDAECGYPKNPEVSLYKEYYLREGIATRVVGVYPDECWAAYPELYETEKTTTTPFEREWNDLQYDQNVWHYLHRVDELSGIGRYGILLIGLDDGKLLSSPARGVDPTTGVPDGKKREQKVIYLRAFDESIAKIDELEKSVTSPRYGQPKMYSVQFTDVANGSGQLSTTTEQKIHWTRVIHVADNRKSSEVYGTPRLEPVLNRIYDLRKILSGSGEMFWKGAFPGYSFDAYPELAGSVTVDLDSLKEEFQNYQNGLQRFLTGESGKWTALTLQVADPSKHVEEHLRVIAMSIRTPYRIFLGSEAGHLASEQDAKTWNGRRRGRQQLYLDPMLVRPTVRRLIDLGVLPPPGTKRFFTHWPDQAAMSDKDKADVSLKKAQALMAFVTGGIEAIMPVKEFFTNVMGTTVEVAESLAQEAAKKREKLVPIGGKPQQTGKNSTRTQTKPTNSGTSPRA